MAATDYTNTVPLGAAGTGAAYILPQSQALGVVDDYIDQQAANRQRAAILKQQQAQQLAAAWQANQLKIKGGTLYQPEINKRAQEVMQLGLDLQKAGVNPNTVSTDPGKQAILEEYQNKRSMLLRDVDTRDAIAKQAQENEKAIAAQAPGYFNPQSVQQYHDYISGTTPLSDISSQGLQMPSLQRAFDLQKVIKDAPSASITDQRIVNGHKIETKLPDEKTHLRTAQNLVANDPQVAADFEQKVGVPFSEIAGLGKKSDLPGITKEIDDYYRSSPSILATKGIPSYNSPEYKEFVDNTAKRTYAAKKASDEYIGSIVKGLNGKEDKVRRDEPYFGYEDQAMQREANQRARTTFNQAQEDRNNVGVTYNVPGTAVHSGAIGEQGTTGPVTHPVMLPNIGKTMVVNPLEYFDADGHNNTNTASFSADLGSPILTPIATVKNDRGETVKKLLNDAEINSIKKGKVRIGGTAVTDKDITYPYMVSAVKTEQVPVMETTTQDGKEIQRPTGKFTTRKTPVLFDASSIKSKLYDKGINYDQIENKLSDFVRSRLVRPDLQPKTVATQKDYDDLKPGEHYVAPDGNTYIKK